MSQSDHNPRATLEDNWQEFYREVLPYIPKDSGDYNSARTVFMSGQISILSQFGAIGELDDPFERFKITELLKLEANRESHLFMFGSQGCQDPCCPACQYVEKMKKKMTEGGGRG